MKKIYIIATIISILIISIPVIAEENFNLKEGKDYICIDKENNKSPPSDNKKIDTKPLCFEGKVPQDIREQYIDDVSLPKEKISIGTISKSTTKSAHSYMRASGGGFGDGEFEGVWAMLSRHSPYIGSRSYYSEAGIRIYNWYEEIISDLPSELIFEFETGWRKTKYDTGPRLYILLNRWCYNDKHDCLWEQASNIAYPGMSIPATGDVEFKIEKFNDDWWINYDGEWLGYYPSTVLSFPGYDGNNIEYFGEVSEPVSQSATDMGNGLFAYNSNAAKIYWQQYKYNGEWKDANTHKYATDPSLYSVLATSPNSMRYGGPGVSITVVSPNGGENWKRGTTKTIKWTKTGNTGTEIKIELLKGGKVNRVISSNAPNTGSYNWKIPTIQKVGTDYKIRITSKSNSIYKDMSNNNFKIS